MCADTKMPRTIVTDQLSNKITNLSDEIEKSDSLWENAALRHKVLLEAVVLLTCTCGSSTGS